MVAVKQKRDRLKNIKKIKDIKGIQIIQQKTNFRRNIQLDYSDLSKFDGVKAYVLISLRKLALELEKDIVDDNKINEIAKELYELSKSPTRYYSGLIKDRDKVKQSKKIMKNKKNTLNNTERAILKCKMSLILLEYVTKNTKFDNINYQELKVYVDFCYDAIYTGVEDKRIKKLELFVGYNSTLADYKIEYKEDGEKYNLNKHIVMFPYWHKIEENRKNYEAFERKFSGLNNKTIDLLVTMEENIDDYLKENEEGNFNNLALKYIVMFEEELRKLLIKTEDIDEERITLKKSIEYLLKGKHGSIFTEDSKSDLQVIINMKKKAASEEKISKEEIVQLRNILIEKNVLKCLSDELNNCNI